MPVLDDPKQERVAQLIAQGVDKGEAYYKVYRPDTRASASSSCSRLLQNEKFSGRVNQILQQVSARYEVTTGNITKELARIAFSNSKDYVRIDDEGNAKVDLTDLSDDAAAAIAEVTATSRTMRRGEDTETVNETKIKIASAGEKIRANELLGKQLGMFKNQTEVLGPNGGPLQINNLSIDFEGMSEADTIAMLDIIERARRKEPKP